MKKWIEKQSVEKKLFLFSFLFLFILGILLSFNYDMKSNYNLLFDSDTSRVILDAVEVVADHYRADVHPLFILWVQPVVFLLTGLLSNKILAIIFLSSCISSLSVVLIYKILDHIRKDKKMNVLLSLIYLFSFSNIIFTAGIETYNFGALFLIAMWYYFVRKEKEKFDRFSFGILVLFAIFTFSFTITNVVVYLIMIFLLWICKKISIKNIFGIGVLSIALVVVLNVGQRAIWQEAPFFWKVNLTSETQYVSMEKNKKENIKEVVTNDYYNSLISSDIEVKTRYGIDYNNQNYLLSFKPISILNFVLISGFYILMIFLLVRNYKKNKMLSSGLILSLIFNSILHTFYGNDSTYLYSLNFLYLLILLLGVNLELEENKKLKSFSKIFLLIFLITEVLSNTIIFGKVLSFVKEIINPHYLVANLGLPLTILIELTMIVIAITIITIEIFLFKTVRKEKNIEKKILQIFLMIALVIGMKGLFIEFDSIEDTNRILWINLEGKSTEIIPKEKLDYLEKDFKETFQEELEALNSYRREIEEIKKEYQTVSLNETNWTDYYYFGMGNRRKIAYRPNKLIDVETKEEIMTFDEKVHYMIPNTYTVLIETKEKDYIILKEDEEGVHYIKNGKDTILEGTSTKINLYSFEGQKYQNIKKVLYGEILFNIKNSVIYPNIIVYENPWYRDAAITCMVLKETGNTDLIKNWVENITEIYDRQNRGLEEADNLGELLYILSTGENKREDLIQKIEEEAERLASNNPNGYYIYGKTDFGDHHLYQNLWYKLGIESVGKTYKYDLNSIPEDSYSKMTWWSTYQIKNNTNNEVSREYPYLSYAERHKLGTGTITLNENLYPLSWEFAATEAKYENYYGMDDHMASAKVSPLHTWSASEFLLLLLEDTGNLKY